MAAEWLLIWKSVLSSLPKLSRFGLPVKKFLKNIISAEANRELRQIENAGHFLKTVATTVAVLKKHGMPEEAIRALLNTTMLPVVQAQADAMVLSRTLSESSPAEPLPATTDSSVAAALAPVVAEVVPPVRAARICPTPHAGIERREQH